MAVDDLLGDLRKPVFLKALRIDLSVQPSDHVSLSDFAEILQHNSIDRPALHQRSRSGSIKAGQLHRIII